MKRGIIVLMSLAMLTAVSCKKKGCMDVTANNYSEKAEKDDGSCDYTPVEINENITTETTFENNNISICSDITISAGLTIPAGTVITMCAGASIEVTSTGYINAIGTADLPIVFKGATETKGFWEGLAIKSNNPNNVFAYVTVKDAGTYWAWEYANVYVSSNSKLSVTNSTFSNSENVGLFIEDDATLSSFSNNTFSNNTTGLNLNVKQLGQIDAVSSYNVGNTNNYIFARSGTITTDVNWVATTTPVLLNGVYVEAGLTISAGANILVEANGYIDVRSTGYISSIGTAANPISITGRYTSAGYWEGLAIKSNNPNNKLAYTTVSDGGAYWAYEYANIFVNTGRLELDNCTVSNANNYGVFVESNSSLYTSGIVQNTAAGVEANNTITGNGTGANANCTNGCTVFFE